MELGEIIRDCPVVLYSRRPDGPYAFTNLGEQAQALFGLNRDAWLQEGGDWLAEIHEQDRSRVLEGLAAVRIGKQQVRYRLRTGPGEYRWIRDDMTLVDGGEAGSEIVGCWIDVTEQQAVETSLREDEQRYRELVENTNSLILQMDIDGRITFFGEYAQTFFGYSAEEIIGRSILDTIVPGDQPLSVDFAELIDSFKAAPEHFAVTEDQNVTRDGRRVWVSWTNRAVYDAAGDVVGVLSIGRDVTERKLAQMEIAQLAKFPDENPHPMLRISHDGIVLYSNAASARLLEAWQAQGSERLPDIWLETIQRAVETGETQRFESGFGDTVFSFTVISVVDADYVNVYGDDVTEHLEAQRVLQDTLQFNESIISSAGDGIVVYDRQKRYVVWNAAMEELTGVVATNVLGRRALTPYAPSVREGVDALLDRALAGETIETGERYYRVDASERAGWVEIRYTPLRDVDDAITGVIGMVRDVTAQRQVQDNLYQTNEALRTLIQSSPLAIIACDANKHITQWNRAAEQMFGWKAEEVTGGPLPFIPDDGRDQAEEILNQVLGGRTYRGMEGERRRKDGSVIYTSLSLGPMRSPDGSINSTMGVVTDITEQKRAEQGIRQLNTELERRVAQRTAELEAANQELEAFTYSVSHDLRAPLRGMDGFSQILLEDYAGLLDDQGKDYLNRVRAASQRMALLIDDLLKLSRVTRSELKQQHIDLSELARAVVAELHNEEPDRSTAVSIEEGMSAQGDKQLMQLVLENLLGNAWKFTHQVSSAAIEFGTVKIAGEQSYFVRDNGAGFDMAYADKLFQPFQRLHTTEEFPGTGIGLATVQRIINRHGGRVWAEGAVDGGAVFYFTLAARSGDGK